jgi:hypothetical protein
MYGTILSRSVAKMRNSSGIAGMPIKFSGRPQRHAVRHHFRPHLSQSGQRRCAAPPQSADGRARAALMAFPS